MYKMLLDKKLVLSDMESVDSEFYNSVKYILDNDPEPLCLSFTAAREFLGKVCGCGVGVDVGVRVAECECVCVCVGVRVGECESGCVGEGGGEIDLWACRRV